MTEIKKPKNKITRAEIITTTILLLFISVISFITVKCYNGAQEYARERSCLINQKEIARVALMYLQDHNKSFPVKENFWKDISVEPEYLICSTKGKKTLNGYAYNSQLNEISIKSISNPSKIFLTCDSDNPDNLWYTTTDSAKRHKGKCIYSFVDGHVSMTDINY